MLMPASGCSAVADVFAGHTALLGTAQVYKCVQRCISRSIMLRKAALSVMRAA